MHLCQIKLVIGLFIVTLLTGCDQSNQSRTMESKASEYTVASNQQFAENLNIEHQQDFENARRGMVAAAPNE